MSKKIDLIGGVFGMLTVVSEFGRDNGGRVLWTCLCECGNTTIVQSYNLKNGTTKSCGCFRSIWTINKFTKHGQSKISTKSAEYISWQMMKARCYKTSDKYYSNYGGRGIIVCDRWLHSFENFFEDMGKKPTSKHTLDRYPNPNGNYEPSNCRWATPREQQGNRTNNNWIEYNGIKKIQADWARELGINPSNLCNQLKNKTFSELAKSKMDGKK